MNEPEYCVLCPRECGADRINGMLGYCTGGLDMRIASICIHKGEEPVICGNKGICNVFFAGCNMKCVFCQNYQISHGEYLVGVGTGYAAKEGTNVTFAPVKLHAAHKSGDLRERKKGDLREICTYPEYSIDDAADAIIKILDTGINAVGFVTPGHYLPQVKDIINTLNNKGYFPVIVYNTNGYEKPENLRQLEGIVDVYLPDFKYLDGNIAAEYSDAGDYPDVIRLSIKEMYRQKGSTVILDDDGQAVSGMIIRHLVLPGGCEDSKNILKWIAENLSLSVHISLMSQYHPTEQVRSHPLLGRTLKYEEYHDVVRTLEEIGFYNGWIQELSSSDYYNPDFSMANPFGEG